VGLFGKNVCLFNVQLIIISKTILIVSSNLTFSLYKSIEDELKKIAQNSSIKLLCIYHSGAINTKNAPPSKRQFAQRFFSQLHEKELFLHTSTRMGSEAKISCRNICQMGFVDCDQSVCLHLCIFNGRRVLLHKVAPRPQPATPERQVLSETRGGGLLQQSSRQVVHTCMCEKTSSEKAAPCK